MFKIIKKLGKIVSALGVIALLGSQVLSAPLSTQADAPRFNFLSGDKELMTGKNHTAGETVYTDPVTAGASDQLVGMVYYHNGVPDTTATNTRVSVNLDTSITSVHKVSTAAISADNAATVTDTIVDGQIVGQSGLTVNTPEADSHLEFVPGSVRWFPNQGSDSVALPNGQTGDTLVTSGINIGDIQGCWPFSGFVAFGMRVITPAPPVVNITIDKKVKNETLGESTFVDSNSGRPSDTLNYQLVIGNTGEAVASPVILRDSLPVGVTLVPDTIKLYANGSPTETVFPNNDGQNVFSSGASLGQINIGSSARVTFSARLNQSGLSDGQNLINTAHASVLTINVSDTASTRVVIESAIFARSKSAFNISKNVDATTVLAEPGNEIRYTLTTKNSGNGAGSVTVEDGLADILEYSDVTDLGGGQLVNQPTNANEDNRVMIVYPESTLAAGQTVTKSFTVKVKNPLPSNPRSGNHYDLTLFNVYGNQVLIHIKPPEVLVPILTLVKNVRDVTTNEINFSKEDRVFAGDILEYQLIITNSGNGPADGVKIVDTLPANLAYIPGTTVLSADGTSLTLVDGITGAGITLPQVPAGATYLIYLRAHIDTGVAANLYLVNTATVTSGSISLTDTAKSLVLPEAVVASVPPTVTGSRLPVTGASSIFVSLFGSLFALTNLVYFRGKKELLKAALLAQI